MTGSPNWSEKAVFPSVFRVFEHDLLRVGDEADGKVFSEKHLAAFASFAERSGGRYFTVGHRAIRFKHFVGILAMPQLSIEILPKIDRGDAAHTAASWQRVLIDMLRICKLVRPESTGISKLDTRPGELLDWYIRIYVAELKRLLSQGLLHTYECHTENLPVWKGALQLAQHLQRNNVHRERFFVKYEQFTNRHPANLRISAAVHKLLLLPLRPEVKSDLEYLQSCFPTPAAGAPPAGPQALAASRDRRLARYAPALQITDHILQEELPDVRAGAQAGLALLFDMNLLFEEYLYRQLVHWQPAHVQIERQESRVFWGQNRLRPDLVISSPQGRWVLDTKWRMLPQAQPTADELRQIYVYCDYFQADAGVLVYPHLGDAAEPSIRSFAPLPGGQDQKRACRVCFARVLRPDGRLNTDLGRELLDVLGIDVGAMG